VATTSERGNAALLAKQGQADRAAELLKLASIHPASEQAVQDKAKRLMEEMGLVPPDSAPEPLATVAAEVLAEITPH